MLDHTVRWFSGVACWPNGWGKGLIRVRLGIFFFVLQMWFLVIGSYTTSCNLCNFTWCRVVFIRRVVNLWYLLQTPCHKATYRYMQLLYDFTGCSHSNCQCQYEWQQLKEAFRRDNWSVSTYYTRAISCLKFVWTKPDCSNAKGSRDTCSKYMTLS